jgi:hypothetical protein
MRGSVLKSGSMTEKKPLGKLGQACFPLGELAPASIWA